MDLKNKKGVAIILVGREGQGKTPTTKDFAKNWTRRKLVYDLQHEYDDTWDRCDNADEFRREINKATNTLVVIEEATVIMSSYNKEKYLEFLISQQHRRNVIILNFHGWRHVPAYLIGRVKWVFWFKTGETREEIIEKEPRLEKFMKDEFPRIINTKDDKIWYEEETL